MTKMRLLYNFSTFQGTTQLKRTFSDGTKRIGARDGEHNAQMPHLIIHRRNIVVFATWDKERVSHGLSHRARHKKNSRGTLTAIHLGTSVFYSPMSPPSLDKPDICCECPRDRGTRIL